MYTLVRYFYKRLTSHPKRRVAMFGLDNAGKTVIFNAIATIFGQQTVDVAPTLGQNVCRFTFGGISYEWADLGGSAGFRESWKYFLEDLHAVVFVIDPSEQSDERWSDVQSELQKLLSNPALQGCPVVLCINKTDLSPGLPFGDVEALIQQAKVTGASSENTVDVVQVSGLTGHNVRSLLETVDRLLKNDPYASARAERIPKES